MRILRPHNTTPPHSAPLRPITPPRPPTAERSDASAVGGRNPHSTVGGGRYPPQNRFACAC